MIKLSLILAILCAPSLALAFGENSRSSAAKQDLQSVLMPLRHTQANPRNSSGSNVSYRSKSEVMAEVKSRYGGQVLRISLNERTASYSVRVLLPNGKVRNLQVSARR